MLEHSLFTIAFAGTCFFMFGMSLASDNLQKLAANRIRDLIAKISNSPLLAVFTGVAVTVLIQSSGAVTSMLVGLGTAGVVSLPQVMGIILGTGIGTTLTVQLLSLNIAQFGLPIFAVAFTVYFLTSKPVLTRVMAVVMGFGLIFWGLEMISFTTVALKDLQIFAQSLDFLTANPFVMLLAAAGFTALVHSSAVTVGIAMSLTAAGLMTVEDAFYWVYGANIGTTATALLAAAGGNYVGRQVAWAHCMHRAAMVSLYYFFTPQIAAWLSSGEGFRDVANAHLLFNVSGAVLFFPFIRQGAQLVEKIIRPGPGDREFSVKYLDRGGFESPAVCVAHSERELHRMGDIVQSMVRDSLKMFRQDDPEQIEDMQNRDNKVDLLNREITLYLTRLMDRHPNCDQNQVMRLISWSADLESAADVIENSMLDLAKKKHSLKLEFSEEGWSDLEELHKRVVDACALALTAFQTGSPELANDLIAKKREIRKLEKTLRERHIERLVARGRATLSTSSIHMDVLSDYRRVVGLVSNHAYGILRTQKHTS